MKPRVTVLGGYLGAGKTTLLNHLLRNAGGRRLAVLVNDFGDVGIDADLIEARDGDVLELAGGCVCCSFGSDLVGGLARLAQRVPQPDHILVETSGVALPRPVGQAVGLVAALALDAVVVVADAQTVRRRAADRYVGDTVAAQLQQADLVVANKLDLVEAGERSGLADWLGQAAPAARIIDAIRAQVPAEVVLGWRETPSPVAVEAWLETPPAGRWRSLRPAPPTPFISAGFRFTQAVDLPRLARGLTDPALGVLRAKGLMRDTEGTQMSLQQVGSRSELRPLPYPDPDTGRLACIGLRDRLDRDAISTLLEAARQAR